MSKIALTILADSLNDLTEDEMSAFVSLLLPKTVMLFSTKTKVYLDIIAQQIIEEMSRRGSKDITDLRSYHDN